MPLFAAADDIADAYSCRHQDTLPYADALSFAAA